MKNIKYLAIPVIISFCLAAGCAGKQAAARPRQDSPTPVDEAERQELNEEGDFIYHEGEVQIMPPGQTRWQPVDAQTRAAPGTAVKTSPDSFARLRLEDKAEVDVNEQTSFEVTETEGETTLEMFYGAMRARVKDRTEEELRIKTPVAVAAVRGTDFAVIYEEQGRSETEVYGGLIEVAALPYEDHIFPPAEVGENLYAVTRRGRAPEIIGEITETRKLRWIHLQERLKTFRNLRRRREIDAALRRNRGLLRAADEEEERERIREHISRLRTERAALEEEIVRGEERLKDIGERYSQIIEEKARQRRRLIEERREQIIQQRLERIEKEREERRQRLEE